MRISMENLEKIFGEYRILQLLGEGQYTKVYLAQKKESQDRVALKIFHGLYASDPTFRRRLEREFSLVNRLKNPNLVKYFETGEVRGLPYISMEYLGEITLQRLLSYHGRAPISIAVSVMEQVLYGLAFLHSEEIIHRDIKPSAIFISRSGKVTLADLDIAKPYADDYLTRKGSILGSPRYMAPEQKLGEQVSPKSDIYAAGIVFYELITGQTPWKDKDFLPTDRRAWATLTYPSELVSNVSPELDKFILRAIELQPGRRFKSANEMLAVLRGFHHASEEDLRDWIGGRRVPDISNQRNETKAKSLQKDNKNAKSIQNEKKPKPKEEPQKRNKWLPVLAALTAIAVLVFGVFSFNVLFPSAYFKDDFSNAQTIQAQWTQVNGAWTQNQGAYSCQISQDGCLMLANKTPSGNYSLQVDVRGDNGIDKAIYFGELDMQKSYMLILRSDPANQVAIVQKVNGQSDVEIAQISLNLSNGKWYKVQILINGRSINVKIDNQVVLQTTIPDSAPDFQGQAGLGIPTNNDGVVSVASFDNFEIILQR